MQSFEAVLGRRLQILRSSEVFGYMQLRMSKEYTRTCCTYMTSRPGQHAGRLLIHSEIYCHFHHA